MTIDEILNKVKTIISEHFAKDKSGITGGTDLHDELALDSLDGVELIMTLEDEFQISITDEDAHHVHTVGDVAEYVRRKIEAQED